MNDPMKRYVENMEIPHSRQSKLTPQQMAALAIEASNKPLDVEDYQAVAGLLQDELDAAREMLRELIESTKGLLECSDGNFVERWDQCNATWHKAVEFDAVMSPYEPTRRELLTRIDYLEDIEMKLGERTARLEMDLKQIMAAYERTGSTYADTGYCDVCRGGGGYYNGHAPDCAWVNARRAL